MSGVQVVIWWSGLMRGAVSIALVYRAVSRCISAAVTSANAPAYWAFLGWGRMVHSSMASREVDLAALCSVLCRLPSLRLA